MFAITEFTQEVGATRVVPGSNRWPDFTRRPEPAEITTAESVSRAGLT